MTIRFKRPEYEAQLDRSHPLLKPMVERVALLWADDCEVTSVERNPGQAGVMGAKSPHTTFAADGITPRSRAADLGVHNIPWPRVLSIADEINAKWEYDPWQPTKHVAVPEDLSTPGATAPHLHVQVTDRTRPRAPKMETA